MLPNPNLAISFFSQKIKKLVVEMLKNEGRINFKVVSSDTINACVQPAQGRDLKFQKIDYSLNYIWIHTKEKIEINNIIEYSGDRYRVRHLDDYKEYGYYRGLAEQLNKKYEF